jgi:hypothetical protein
MTTADRCDLDGRLDCHVDCQEDDFWQALEVIEHLAQSHTERQR